VAVAEMAGPKAGLDAIEGLGLDSYPYLHATRESSFAASAAPAKREPHICGRLR
jgi:hypothetical protein